MRGVQYSTPLFEFSGACAGCGETPYLRLLTQLFGDRLLVANATGCSSIYGGNLPTTPWSVNNQGAGRRGPTRSSKTTPSSGSAIRLSLDKHREQAEELLARARAAARPGARCATSSTRAQVTQDDVDAQRHARRRRSSSALECLADPRARRLRTLTSHLVRKSVWIVGGDGWAYDIGYGGLDHVLASGRNVNILVLDTEVYSNTGGQASKATPRARRGEIRGRRQSRPQEGPRPDGGGLRRTSTSRRLRWARRRSRRWTRSSRPRRTTGPSLIIAYSHCIAHGINMRFGMRQQKLAVDCGHWPLYRYKPAAPTAASRQEFVLDSQPPSIPLKTYAYNEIRYKMLSYTKPDEAKRLLGLAQEDIDQRWRVYTSLADRWPATARRGQGETGSHVPAPAAASVTPVRRGKHLETHHEPDHSLHGPDAQEPAGGLGVAAVGEPRRHPPARRQRRGGRRHVLAVRRADPPRFGGAGALHEARAPRASARRCRTFPRFGTTTSGPSSTWS